MMSLVLRIVDRLKSGAFTALAVLAVLGGAYALGGRAARRSASLEQERREKEGAQNHIREVQQAIEERQDAENAATDPNGKSSVDWMRDFFSRD